MSKDSIIYNWIHSVVNIECRALNAESIKQVRQLLNHEKNTKEILFRMRDSIDITVMSASGTAVLLNYHNVNYLLTPRHVLYDRSSSDSNQICSKIILIETDTILNKYDNRKADENRNLLGDTGTERTMLSNLSAGLYKDDIIFLHRY